MFTPSPFVFRASPEKLRDYSEHQAATYHFPGAPCSLEPAALAARLLKSLLPSRRRLLRPEQPHPRHAQQPDPAQPAGLADDRRLAVQAHRGRVRRVGRNALRRPPAPARAMCVSAACPHCALAAVAIPAHRPQSCSQTRACRGCVRFARLDPQRCQRPCFF